MKNIYLHELKEKLTEKLNPCYIFLGEDFFLIKKNQDLILNFAYKNGFLEKMTIDIEKNTDWEKIIIFLKKKNLFFRKTILFINILIKKLNMVLIKNINEIFSFLHSDTLIILKLNHLSFSLQANHFLNQSNNNISIVSCSTPYNLNLFNWLKYEIKEKNINIEEKAFFLLCKYYEGNTLFIYNILDIILITWPNTFITIKKIKKIIIDFFNFSPLHWINAIFEGKIKKSIYILNVFYKQKYNPLFLIRFLQKDLLKLIYMKREKNINIDMFLKKSDIWTIRHKYFVNAFQKTSFNTLFKAIQILVKIEIKIKKKHDNSIWNQLHQLTLILC